MKNALKKATKKILEPLSQVECLLSSIWVSSAHKRLKWVEWSLPPQPEHFDHQIDLYYKWLRTRNPFWVERGVFGNLTIEGGDVLELACGDGFNARNFYSLKSRSVIACDFDKKAIQTANKINRAPNVRFILADIRNNMPTGNFDNVIWDAAIEHFTPIEIEKIIKEIKLRLKKNGILSGYTIVEKNNGQKSLSHHEYEFKNKEDLMRFFSPHFKKVTIFETIYPDRHNLYFWASDRELPFTPGWPHSIHETKN